MYPNRLHTTTSVTKEQVPVYQLTKSGPDIPEEAPATTGDIQFVINLENENSQEFFLNEQGDISPLLPSRQSDPRLLSTNQLQPLLEAIRTQYAAQFLVYALTLDEFTWRRKGIGV